MRSVTKAEAEQDIAAVLDSAAQEPVRIRQAGRDVIIVSAAEFEEAQLLLHKKRMRALQRARLRATAEAKANGFTEEMLTDPRDDKFLEVAVHGKADAILTGDADLLTLDPFQRVRIVTPQEFLALPGWFSSEAEGE
ncbi:MAG: putative toxin-antitoxin system toxin component, PIN family [Terracidiphilus sp.]|jgi:predicted nucleic acid-binding protein